MINPPPVPAESAEYDPTPPANIADHSLPTVRLEAVARYARR
jgi:hypothetical protein